MKKLSEKGSISKKRLKKQQKTAMNSGRIFARCVCNEYEKDVPTD